MERLRVESYWLLPRLAVRWGSVLERMRVCTSSDITTYFATHSRSHLAPHTKTDAFSDNTSYFAAHGASNITTYCCSDITPYFATHP
jgi:hypothetical protein